MSLSLLVLLCSAAIPAETPAQWPGFLGAGATPLAADALPLQWAPGQNIAWTADLPGHGQSSPVVWGDRVFLTAVEGPMKDSCLLMALSLGDGKVLWRHSIPSSDPVKSSLYVSRAAPTPVVDEQRVYAFFESGDLVALTHDGKPAWNRSLSKEHGKFQNKFGLAASPAQIADRLFVLVDDEGPSYLAAIRKEDGQTLWRTTRTSRTSWSSPAVITLGGEAQVVCSSAGSVDGYSPQTGELLWTFADVGGNTAATPIDRGDGRFLVGASAGREGQNVEGARKSNLSLTVSRVNGQWTPEVQWRNEQASPSFGSPIVHQGCAYWVNRAGVVYCVDAATGQLHYTQRTAESVWATPLAVGDRIYLFGKDGLTTVIAAGPKFEKLAENRVWDPADAKPDIAAGKNEETEERRRAAAMFSGPVQYGVAAVGSSLLIRTGEKLFCVRRSP